MTAPFAVATAPSPEQDSSSAAPGTLAFARSTDYPAVKGDPKYDPRKSVDYVQRLLNDTQFDTIGRYKLATQHLLFMDGRQHIDWALREKIWMDTPQADGKVRVTMNYIRPILQSRIQRMVSPQMSWRATPQDNSYEERDRSVVGANFLTHRWRKTEMDAKLRYAIWLAFGCGAAWLKSFWNPKQGSLSDATVFAPHPTRKDDQGNALYYEYPVDQDGNLLEDAEGNPSEAGGFQYRQGDTDTAVRSLFNIRVNRDASGLDSADGFRWLMDTDVVPIWTVKEKYGAVAKNVSTVAGITTIRNYESIVRSITAPYGTITGNDLLTGRDGGRIPDRELTLLTEYWEPPSELLPQGRLVVIAGNELMSDTELPQGVVPYVSIYDERRPYDPYGRSNVRDLVSPQKVINQQWGMIMQEQGLAAVGQWIGFDVPGLFDQVTSATGAHIKVPLNSAVMNKALEGIIHRLQPAQSSPDRWHLIEEAKKAMFDIGAFHEIQRGQIPPGVDSGIAVQLLQEAENGQLADPIQELKKSLIGWGIHQLKIGRWGYDDDEVRWLPVHRPDLGFQLEDITGLNLPDPDDIDIDLEGYKPQSQAAMRAEIKELMQMQILDPRKGLQLMDLGRGVEGAFESQQRHYAKARKENLALEKGQLQLVPSGQDPETGEQITKFVNPDGSDVLLPDDDDHQVHIEIHQDLALDTTKPWPVRQNAILMCHQHREAMQAVAQGANLGEMRNQVKLNNATQPPGQLPPGAAPGGAPAAPPSGA